MRRSALLGLMAAAMADVGAGGADLVRRYTPPPFTGPLPTDFVDGNAKIRRHPGRPAVGGDPRGKRLADGKGRIRYRRRVRINGRKVAVVVRG